METCRAQRDAILADVLIVPCGMETKKAFHAFTEYAVLIVPCGMETTYEA